ncbi:MAG TPA: hypothetical protein PLO62_09985 [Candidatus Hydrogenedentes bacterium]|nr:hypothetical protein [Candidatus Hydrogenedentota bacterium]HOS02342.1 hypothetical protein [Candidatus Hydrogenedentota bacterium]
MVTHRCRLRRGLIGCLTIAAALLGLPAGLAAQSDARAAPEKITVSVTALRATQENRSEVQLDADLEPLRKALGSVKNCDTFRKITEARIDVPFGAEKGVDLTAHYALYVTAVSKENDGRVRIKARIEECAVSDSEKRTRTAVSAVSSMAPGGHLVLAGLKLDDAAQFVAVLSVE